MKGYIVTDTYNDVNYEWLARIDELKQGLDDSDRSDIDELVAKNELMGAMYMAEHLNQVRYQPDIDGFDVTREATDVA